MRYCSKNDCSEKHHGKGFCLQHYNDLPEVKERIKNWYNRTRDIRLKKLKDYSRTIKGRFINGKSIAKKRKISWEINIEDYENIIDANCYYCSGELGLTGYGLDRKNNNLGYTTDNVVSCCWKCNKLKSDLITPEEMKEVIKLLKTKRNSTQVWK